MWLGAFLTLCIFSFLYKDNPFYRFAEHLFVGVSAGYYIILNFWTVIVPNLWEPLVKAWGNAQGHTGMMSLFLPRLGDYRIFLVLPGVLGLMLFSRFFGRIGWLSRWSLAVILGVYAGIRTTGAAQADFVAQVQGSLQPLWVAGHLGTSLNAIIFTVGLVTSLLFFFYSREHKGSLGVASKLGIYFLMVSFGAGYGYTVMSRISLLIGRFQFLLEDWLGLK
ncbi:MAG: hypothetical protein HY076_02235 [Candidatus Eisenbacteria bacterium]|uniref:Uncharacterized protein n=1 Tax=Eiseniibacteriota bacterium TaxID=2212470 RepID=A0A9D6QJB8_UNCEI|nr:hypothetical protein [Candidatus Eisenbacteria bacterium]MBI3539075.1 hypothetical protein [Candidatus Eisenbacteria bacterium]